MIHFHPDTSLPADFWLEGLVLPIDKPYGWTSADVVRKVQYLMRRYTGNRKIKVGHAGTLDPLATGVLLLCIGAATRQANLLLEDEKEYIATVRFGATTPSFDLEKPIDALFPFAHIHAEEVRAALPHFLGDQTQVPPIFSAKMVGGVRSYALARKGKEVELEAHPICIREAELLSFVPGDPRIFPKDSGQMEVPDVFPVPEGSQRFPLAQVRIRCSKGTYIRSFARDLGLALHSGAHLYDLRRTSSGAFNESDLFDIHVIEQYFSI